MVPSILRSYHCPSLLKTSLLGAITGRQLFPPRSRSIIRRCKIRRGNNAGRYRRNFPRFRALNYRPWMSLTRAISNASNSDDAPDVPYRRRAGPRLHSPRALHFTISRHGSPRTYVQTRAVPCHRVGPRKTSPRIHPVCMRHIRGGYILRCGPPAISDRCLWPDTITRRTFIFLPVTFIPRILINSDLGHRRTSMCISRYRGRYDRFVK